MTSASNSRPLPVPDEASRPFFEGARQHQLMLLRCLKCNHPMWPASHSGSLPVTSHCHKCFSAELEWQAAEGRGSLYSFAVMHQPYPGFQNDVPYNIALVELTEGVRCLSSVVGCRNEDLVIGMPLQVDFEDLDDAISLPKFRRSA
jgi:uncharacterized OB-fold protein